MVKKYKFDWKIVFGIIIIILVILLARSLLLNSDEDSIYKNSNNIGISNELMLETLDEYYDRVTECSLQLGTFLNNLDLESTKSQIYSCQNEVNNALSQIYKWNRDNPSKETKAMRLDYEASSYFLSSISIVNDYNINSYPLNDLKSRQKQALFLMDKYIDNLDLVENSYSNTNYYRRYYKDKEEWEESKKIIIDLRKQLKEALETCPEEYVLVDGYLCYKECGEGYCQEGYTCCNNKCITCPVGAYLGTDCKCYYN